MWKFCRFHIIICDESSEPTVLEKMLKIQLNSNGPSSFKADDQNVKSSQQMDRQIYLRAKTHIAFCQVIFFRQK